MFIDVRSRTKKIQFKAAFKCNRRGMHTRPLSRDQDVKIETIFFCNHVDSSLNVLDRSLEVDNKAIQCMTCWANFAMKGWWHRMATAHYTLFTRSIWLYELATC